MLNSSYKSFSVISVISHSTWFTDCLKLAAINWMALTFSVCFISCVIISMFVSIFVHRKFVNEFDLIKTLRDTYHGECWITIFFTYSGIFKKSMWILNSQLIKSKANERKTSQSICQHVQCTANTHVLVKKGIKISYRKYKPRFWLFIHFIILSTNRANESTNAQSQIHTSK